MRLAAAKKLKRGDVVLDCHGVEVVIGEVKYYPVTEEVVVADVVTGRRLHHTDVKPKK